MTSDYSDPQWLSALAGIMRRQAARCKDPGHADLTHRLAGYFEAQSRGTERHR